MKTKNSTPAQRLEHLKTKGYRIKPFTDAWPLRYAEDGRAAFHELSQLSGLREAGFCDELEPRLIDHRGWFRTAEDWGGEVYRGFVWRLPARGGRELFLAGFKDEDGGAVTLDTSRGRVAVFDSQREAARAADELARIHAEDEREHDERWQEASRAADEREEARQVLKEAREKARAAIAALREQRAAGAVAGGVCTLILRAVEDARETMREALATIAEKGAEIERLDMAGEF